jgi:hypothetical protein
VSRRSEIATGSINSLLDEVDDDIAMLRRMTKNPLVLIYWEEASLRAFHHHTQAIDAARTAMAHLVLVRAELEEANRELPATVREAETIDRD